jgi:putative endonuclease
VPSNHVAKGRRSELFLKIVWFVYVVRCADRTLYTGITTDAGKRVAEHNRGRGARYTRARRPVELVYLERAADRAAAQRRESEIKRMPALLKQRMIAGRSVHELTG